MTSMTETSDLRRAEPLLAPLLWIVLGLWLFAVVTLARAGTFVPPGIGLPLALATAAIAPGLLFLAAYRLIPALRHWVGTLDLALVTATQTWRVLGVVFLFLWALGDLPAVFAFPAGVGDVAVGVLAVFVTVAVARKTAWARNGSMLLLSVGVADFILAFGSAILSGQGRPLQLEGAPLPDMMQELPMALIPTFGVPLFLILHLIAWLKLRTET